MLYVLNQKSAEEGDDDDQRVTNVVYTLCFILAGLAFSNEMMEGVNKTIFSMRAVTGIYEDVRPHSMWVGIYLGVMQTLTPLCAMSLSMRVVAEAETVLDAFLNYVALAFLTEIDNIVMNSRVVHGFLRFWDREPQNSKVVLKLKPVGTEAPQSWRPEGK